ncbi:MAG: hypothetical protein ACNYPF_02505 [Candidatus Puniceispirillales bacterium WSBS_2018_MAG_OTU23]
MTTAVKLSIKNVTFWESGWYEVMFLRIDPAKQGFFKAEQGTTGTKTTM